MACSHSAACPLFPLLNASLDGWRSCYCDSSDGWRGCARYQQSLRGQYVPLSLLPNGHDAGHLRGAAVDRAGGAAAPGGAPTLVDLLFEHAPSPDRAPAPAPPTPTPPPGLVRQSWWNRLAEWMRTPA